MPESIADISRKARERVTSAPEAEAPAEATVKPYVDATEAVLIPGTSKEALIVRHHSSGALYASTRNVSGSGRAQRVHVDALATLGYVHVDDASSLADLGFISLDVLTDAERKKVLKRIADAAEAPAETPEEAPESS